MIMENSIWYLAFKEFRVVLSKPLGFDSSFYGAHENWSKSDAQHLWNALNQIFKSVCCLCVLYIMHI